MAIKWLFFDIGDVLFDEDAPHVLSMHSILKALRRNGVAVELDEFRMRVQNLARTVAERAIAEATREYVPDEAEFTRIYHEGRAEYEEIRKPRPYGVLLNDITPVVRDLGTEFRLGIIANQHPPILQALDDYGIASLFRVTVIDSIVGVSKPDPAIFHIALQQAGCQPEEALMIGDRPDNDIAPAKSIGMRTIRLRRGLVYVWYDATTEAERADIEVRRVDDIAPAVRRLAALAGA